MAKKTLKGQIDELRTTLIDFVVTIEATGGVTDRQGNFHPVVDEEWTDLGDAYIKACTTLGRKPKVSPYEGDWDKADPEENAKE